MIPASRTLPCSPEDLVILLIYEYAIAVEWSLVQNRKSHRRSNNTIIVNDTPVADRLDRSYFGFDQDYYERMPLLVNAMQENSYIDPSIDIPMQKRGKYIDISHTNPIITTNEPKHTNSIRRTSPRPFIYEQRSPTPVPFSKTFRSKSWIESYRNAERLKNIQQIIRYLEKTINAKAGDMHGLPPSTHIAFSGVYVEPYNHNENKGFDESSSIDLLLESSNNVETIKSSQQSDPLFKYKPDRPGDVNLLADSYLRFIPTTAPKSLYNREYAKVPMFRPIPVPSQKKPFDLLQASSVNNNLNNKSINKAKTFSVMLNLYPLIPYLDSKAKINNIDSVQTEKSTPNNIYFTTSRPLFRRKSAIRRTSVSNKRPRMFNDYKQLKYKDVMFNSKDKTTDSSDPEKNANMIVKVNIYHADKAPKLFEKQENDTQTNTKALNLNNTVQRNFAPVTDMPMQLSTTQVEDHHLGSSGIIPVENRSVPSPVLPIVTTMIPFFDITPASTNTWPTNSPEILKFSPEDAKIPDQYINIKTNYNPHSNIFKIGRRSFSENIASNEKKSETRTLIIKLKNDSENVTEENTTQNKIKEETTTELSNDTTTKENQIKHINGHYRSKFITKQWLDPNSEANRKRRLQLFAKGFRRPNSNSSYIEIDRSKNLHESNLKDTTSK